MLILASFHLCILTLEFGSNSRMCILTITSVDPKRSRCANIFFIYTLSCINSYHFDVLMKLSWMWQWNYLHAVSWPICVNWFIMQVNAVPLRLKNSNLGNRQNIMYKSFNLIFWYARSKLGLFKRGILYYISCLVRNKPFFFLIIILWGEIRYSNSIFIWKIT